MGRGILPKSQTKPYIGPLFAYGTNTEVKFNNTQQVIKSLEYQIREKYSNSYNKHKIN